MLTVRAFKHSKCLRIQLLPQIVQQSTAHEVQPATSESQDRYEKHLKTFETLTNVTKRVRTKKPNRPPFTKNLFLGKFDKEILTYPQLEKQDYDPLEKDSLALQKVLHQSHMVNCKSLSEKHFRQNLSDYKAIGLQAPQLMNARGCNVTESFKFLETLCEHSLAQSLVTHEQLAVQILVTFANENLQRKYLPPIIQGEYLVALCLNEIDGFDINSFKTKAELTGDKKQWILNGEKKMVFNGCFAKYFIVYAITDINNDKGDNEVKLSAFLVDTDSPGVTIKKYDTPGINIADVSFSDTPVPAEHVIGKVNAGNEMLSQIITESRLAFGPMCITLSKRILNNLVKEILQKNDSSHKTDAVRSKIAQIASSIYGMESLVYLTTGLIDNYENQDVELESAIVKVFCREKLMRISLDSLDIIGAPAASETHWANEIHREALRYLTLHENTDVLKLMLVLLGLQHAGTEVNERIQKLRNPFFHAGYHLKSYFSLNRDENDNPKLELFLQEHLHQSLHQSALDLDYCVQRLRYGTESLFVDYGSEVVSKHMELERLANCIIDIYAMVAMLGRASRSYCIGLLHADLEMLIAQSFCTYAVDRVKANISKIVGDSRNNDVNYRLIAKRMFKFKDYCVEHPLKRFY